MRDNTEPYRNKHRRNRLAGSGREALTGLVLLALLAGAIGWSGPAAADEVGDDPGVSGTLTTDPLGLLAGRVNLQIEGAASSFLSLYGGINFLVIEPLLGDSHGRVFGVGPEIGLRFYLIGDAPEGWYLGPYMDIAYLTRDDSSDVGYALGGATGFNLILFDALVLSAGASLGYETMVVDLDDDAQPDRVGIDGYDLRLRLAAGFAF